MKAKSPVAFSLPGTVCPRMHENASRVNKTIRIHAEEYVSVAVHAKDGELFST